MASTTSLLGESAPSGWRQAGLLYHSRAHFWQARLAERVWRVALDAGLDCPNRDAAADRRGCIFCDPASFSPGRRWQSLSVTAQLDGGIRRIRTRRKAGRFLAYLQAGTNTYAPIESLRALWEEALAHPAIVGLVIGTRPDCARSEVLDLLEELAFRAPCGDSLPPGIEQPWISVEYGLQSIHDRSLRWLGRGHSYEDFVDAVGRSRGRRLEIGAHVILALPGESREDMAATARELARLRIDAIKLHNLHAVRGTPLAEAVARGRVQLAEMDEYVACAVDFLERLPEGCVVDRLSGDAPSQYLLAPRWCLDRTAVRAAILAEFRRRGTWQGAKS